MGTIGGRGKFGVGRRVLSGIITNGLKLYLDAGKTTSYPGTGTLWTDISGNGNNGTLNGGVTYSSANSGSLVFNGSTGYISINSNLILNVNSGFTISSFFKITSYTGTYPTLFTLKTSVGDALVLLFQSSGTYAPLSFGWNGGSVYKPSTTISTNTWYNITIRYNGNGINSSSNFTMYINGVSVSLGGSGGFAGIGQVNSLGTLNNGSGGFWFNGDIPNIQIYDRALSATEILQNYNTLKGRYI